MNRGKGEGERGKGQEVKCFLLITDFTGGMAEWPKAAVLKTVGRASVPWVQILLPPPYKISE